MVEIEYDSSAKDPKTVEKEMSEINKLLELVNSQLKKPYYAKHAWLSEYVIDIKKKRLLFDKTIGSINIYGDHILICVNSTSQAKSLKSLAKVIEQKFNRATTIRIYSNYEEISKLRNVLKKEFEG